jgi:hypothetical protein
LLLLMHKAPATQRSSWKRLRSLYFISHHRVCIIEYHQDRIISTFLFLVRPKIRKLNQEPKVLHFALRAVNGVIKSLKNILEER